MTVPASMSLDYLERLGEQDSCTLQELAASLASIFHVTRHEVALLRVDRQILRFLLPIELQDAGVVPLSSSAVAARTATTRKAEFYNNFTEVKHTKIFELVKIEDPDSNPSAQVIQKLMSVPVMTNGNVSGVLQICRKALSASTAGCDFVAQDLDKLQKAAAIVARLMSKLS